MLYFSKETNRGSVVNIRKVGLKYVLEHAQYQKKSAYVFFENNKQIISIHIHI